MLLLAALLISTQAAPPAPATPTAPPPPAAASAKQAPAGAAKDAAPAGDAAPATPEAAAARSAASARVRMPVLAQGALVSSAPGFVAPSASSPGLMVFVFEERLTGRMRRSLTMFPSDPSDDVKAMLASATPDTPWRYEASGAVYDYNGRAFLLPVALVALRNPPVPPMLVRETPPELVPVRPAEPARPPLLNAYRSLDEAPSLLRHQDSEPPQDHERNLAAIGAMDEDLAAELERRLAQGVGGAAAQKLPEATLDRAMVQPAGIRLQDRRAVVTRDPITGAWRAVLEAAPAAGAPLAMELLPCRELEKVERAVRMAPIGEPWLLSGEVVTSGQRNYLLLSKARLEPVDRWIVR